MRCPCKKEEDRLHREEILWGLSDLPEPLKAASLKAFDVRHPHDRACRGAVLAFIDGTLPTPWLAISGGFETGKSYLAGCVVRGAIEQGRYALYRYVPKLLLKLKDAMDTKTYTEAYARLEEPQVLVLDDLAAEEWSPWAIETLTTLFECYYEERKRLFITTNLPIESLPPRIRRRIEYPETCTVILNKAPRYSLRKG